MDNTDASATNRPVWPVAAAIVAGFCIAGSGLVFDAWLVPGLLTGGAIMALGALGALAMLRMAQRAYHRVLADQADNRQKYESLVGNLPGAVYRGDWNADWTMNFMSEGIRRMGASHASMVSAVGPVATIALGFIFLGEPITAIQVVGAILVMVGVLAISLGKR